MIRTLMIGAVSTTAITLAAAFAQQAQLAFGSYRLVSGISS
jgi:hypothetical protein